MELCAGEREKKIQWDGEKKIGEGGGGLTLRKARPIGVGTVFA